MTFSWPYALLLLLALPLLFGGYLLALRRRKRRAVTYSSIALVRAASPGRATWKRHAPVVLLLTALAGLGTAAARPQARITVPVAEAAVIIALDVSGSMCATDVDPNRLSAAQSAVRMFVRNQDSRTRIGLVVFSGSAQLAVAPTTQREELNQALDSLTTGRGTTIGAAILKSIDAISQIDPAVAPSDPTGTGASTGGTATPGTEAPGGDASPAPQAAPVTPGNYAPEIVVLLTDGANTRGVTPLEAAKVAAARGVRVYPIGFGTTNPTSLVCTPQQLGGSGFDQFRGGGGGGFGGGGFGGGGGGRPSFLVADEPTLKQVAATTGGTYFSAGAADELQSVLADLPRHVQTQKRDVELTAAFVAAAVLLLLGGAFAAVRWTTFPN